VGRPFETITLSLLEGALPQPTIGADGVPSPESFAAALTQVPTLGDLYVSMLSHGAGVFAQLARLVTASRDDEPTAVLVHCTAGKDRTGVSVALLLDAVGAERGPLVTDYASSQARLAGPWADGMLGMIAAMGVPITPELRALVTETPPAAIEQAFAWIDAEHGSSAAYLRTGGLTDAELDRLHARLVG
jgi:protein-tyrosine phosphatase